MDLLLTIKNDEIKFNYVYNFLKIFNISKYKAKQQLYKITLLNLFKNYSKKYPCQSSISEEEFLFIVSCLI